MKRQLFMVTIVAAILFISLPCNAEYYFDDLNRTAVSSAAAARGGDIAGGAYIWSQNPLEYWQNPAKLGYIKGLSYGTYTSDYKSTDEYRVACTAFGWNGIGFLHPAFNDKQHFGHSVDMKYTYYDYYRNSDTYEYYIQAENYGMGINLIEAFHEDHRKSPSTYDVSLGIMFQRYLINNPGKDVYQNRMTANIGYLLRISPLAHTSSPIAIDIVTGTNWVNPTKEQSYSSFSNDRFKDPLIYGLKHSLAVHGSFQPDFLLDLLGRDFFHEIVSTTFTMDYFDYGFAGDTDDWMSFGYEIGLLNVLYLRVGQLSVDNSSADTEWFTQGFGLRFNYKSIFDFEWNYAETENDYTHRYMHDFMLNINFFELSNLGN